MVNCLIAALQPRWLFSWMVVTVFLPPYRDRASSLELLTIVRRLEFYILLLSWVFSLLSTTSASATGGSTARLAGSKELCDPVTTCWGHIATW